MLRPGVLAFALVLASSPPSLANALSLEDCRARFVADPDSKKSAECFYDAHQPRKTTEQVLELLYKRYPNRPWLALELGHLLARGEAGDHARAAALCREAERQFAARGEALGDLEAWAELDSLALNAGNTSEAENDLARALATSETSGDPKIVLKGKLLEARHRFDRENFEQAYLLVKKIEPQIELEGIYENEKQWLTLFGVSAMHLGHRVSARAAFLRLIDLAKARKDSFAEASARHNLANLTLGELEDRPDEAGRSELMALANQALATAVAASHPEAEVAEHLMLAGLTRGEEAYRHLTRCGDIAKHPQQECDCLYALAERLAARAPRRAERLAERGADAAARAGDPWTRADALWAGLRVSWALGRTHQDPANSLAAIEALRDLQTDSVNRAWVLSDWSADSYWLSGSLLLTREPRDLETAFGVTERRRWHTLLDALDEGHATPSANFEAQQLKTDRATVLERIAAVQQRLLDPELPPAHRKVESANLEALERREQELKAQAYRHPGFAKLHPRDFATLDEIQQALAADQALLSFQIAPWESWDRQFGGGSWLLVVTRTDRRVYRMSSDRVELRPAVQLFVGLFERRDDSEKAPAATLYKELVGPALGDLPRGVRRLIIIPDDVLHTLPFGALRAAETAAPLAASFQISMAPSATLWRRWKKEPVEVAEDTALVLANPRLPFERRAGDAGRGAVRGGMFAAPLYFQPLARASEEGLAALEALGGGRMLTGPQASKAALEHAHPERFGIIHFATHSILDDENPQRSGVLLASGPEAGDGLLQTRDIVKLPLDGKVVVLSSCSSALGTLLPGEGVMGMARAFFQAGAHAVVGSVWPVLDEDAAALFERFYHHLATGESVAAALASAQRDRIGEGARGAAWAGFVVLGDGDLVPLPRGRRPAQRALTPAALGAGLALSILAIWLLIRRHA